MWVLITILWTLSLLERTSSDCGCEGGGGGAGRVPGGGATPWGAPYRDTPSERCAARGGRDEHVGMALVPAGRHQLGSDEAALPGDGEGPVRAVHLPAFRLDTHEVSNAQFSRFAEAAAYVTEAEVFGDSFVFALQLNETTRARLAERRAAAVPWWYKVRGASWRHPEGSGSSLEGRWSHPAVHVSWEDARSYCAWRGARLPSEAEWEAACRAGRGPRRYPWGEHLYPNRTHRANIWQGRFPDVNTALDGFVGTAPVHLFPQNELGLHSIVGNVWEWTADSWGPPHEAEGVKKGGSFLCHRSYCYRYRCSARAHNTRDSSAANLGFRCARSV